MLALQPGQRPLQKSESPAAFENRLRCKIVGRFERISGFRVADLQRDRWAAPAATLGMGAFPLTGEKVFQTGQKERAKFAGGRFHVSEGVPFQKTVEELLG